MNACSLSLGVFCSAVGQKGAGRSVSVDLTLHNDIKSTVNAQAADRARSLPFIALKRPAARARPATARNGPD